MLAYRKTLAGLVFLSLSWTNASLASDHASYFSTSEDKVRARPENISSFVALGDSVMTGFGAPAQSGQVPLFQRYLAARYDQDITLRDLARGGATSQSILNSQLNPALTFLRANAAEGVVTVLDAGGNDLLGFLYSGAYQSTCGAGKLPACYEAVNTVLDRTEDNLDQIFSSLRQAASADNPILVLTYANARLAPGCSTASQKTLFEAALEGASGTTLSRGLNSRIRDLAAAYDLAVVDVYRLLQSNAATTISKDCIHPSAKGYQLIYEGLVEAFENL